VIDFESFRAWTKECRSDKSVNEMLAADTVSAELYNRILRTASTPSTKATYNSSVLFSNATYFSQRRYLINAFVSRYVQPS
jgi:hypothetical protein